MYTIALLAQKGGTGKTTMAVHVAADFEGAGGSAALVDLDPQASAALWGDRRGRSPFVGAVPAGGRLHRPILKMEGETLCRNEVVCMADDVLVLRGPDGGRPQGSPARRS